MPRLDSPIAPRLLYAAGRTTICDENTELNLLLLRIRLVELRAIPRRIGPCRSPSCLLTFQEKGNVGLSQLGNDLGQLDPVSPHQPVAEVIRSHLEFWDVSEFVVQAFTLLKMLPDDTPDVFQFTRWDRRICFQAEPSSATIRSSWSIISSFSVCRTTAENRHACLAALGDVLAIDQHRANPGEPPIRTSYAADLTTPVASPPMGAVMLRTGTVSPMIGILYFGNVWPLQLDHFAALNPAAWEGRIRCDPSRSRYAAGPDNSRNPLDNLRAEGQR